MARDTLPDFFHDFADLPNQTRCAGAASKPKTASIENIAARVTKSSSG